MEKYVKFKIEYVLFEAALNSESRIYHDYIGTDGEDVVEAFTDHFYHLARIYNIQKVSTSASETGYGYPAPTLIQFNHLMMTAIRSANIMLMQAGPKVTPPGSATDLINPYPTETYVRSFSMPDPVYINPRAEAWKKFQILVDEARNARS